jgi:NADH:ubiquinone oxidoreductase subunit 5 (subunit L)/multisubunit Na+/H+ antiporter MnhA subunit
MVKPEVALLLIPLLPLLAGLLAHLLRRWPIVAGGLGIVALLQSALLGVSLFVLAQKEARFHFERPWIDSGNWSIPLALDAGFGQLLFVVTTALLAAGILLYSLRERRGDPRAGTFCANLTLFAGSMLLLLSADTLLVVYAAWELMGLMSFILIAHSGTVEAKRAARQAFWTTRATDMGLLFAVFILMSVFGWTQLSHIDVPAFLGQATTAAAAKNWLGVVVMLVLVAVVGKSAQWPLSFWLADAMAAPAPVSALLHAATLVAAGPYLLVRLQEAYILPASRHGFAACTAVGAITLLFGGLMALHAREAKRVLAYSTVSQLGLCILGVGLFAAEAAYFQLLAHAWCKAALFLAVGILAAQWHEAHSRRGEARDAALADLAGTARRSPGLRWALLLAAASLAGVPFLGGAWGKEQIFWAAWTRPGAHLGGMEATLAQAFPSAAIAWRIAAILLGFGLVLTAAYLMRLVAVLVGADGARPVREGQTLSAPTAPNGWTLATSIALICAFVGSVATTIVYIRLYHPHFVTEATLWQWMPEKGPSFAIMGITALLTLIGAGWGAFSARRLATEPAGVPAFFARGMYLREFWQMLVTEVGIWFVVLFGRTETNIVDAGAQKLSHGSRALAGAAAWLDQHFVDGLRWQACELWWRIRRLHARWLQNGDVQHYMFIVLACSVVLCLVVIRPLSHIFAQMLSRM